MSTSTLAADLGIAADRIRHSTAVLSCVAGTCDGWKVPGSTVLREWRIAAAGVVAEQESTALHEAHEIIDSARGLIERLEAASSLSIPQLIAIYERRQPIRGTDD